MPIKEESFRTGCGRYIQGKGYVERIGEEVARIGTSPIVVGGRTALGICRGKIEKSLAQKCNKYELITYPGTCCENGAKEIADIAKKGNYDVIVGVGGGVICDFAKLCGYYAKLPVINVPTSSATCAAYTPLSVRYTPEGKTVGTLHYEYEVDGVIADTEIIAAQPTRLLLAGVFDALAKFVEIKQRYTVGKTDYPMGLDYAYVMSEYSHGFLNSYTQKCIDDIKNGQITDVVEKLIFTTIAATGVISGIARGSNQTALAHKFYETTRFMFPEDAKPYLHGEIVGVGLLLQNAFNGEKENNEVLLGLMKKHGMPCSINDIGVKKTDAVFEEYYERLCNSSAINGEDAQECARFREALKYLWEI